MNAHGGGPAFPLAIAEIQGRATTANDFGPDMTGMTLRDYFAAQTIAALADAMRIDPVKTAERAYALADAMLAERSKS